MRSYQATTAILSKSSPRSGCGYVANHQPFTRRWIIRGSTLKSITSHYPYAARYAVHSTVHLAHGKRYNSLSRLIRNRAFAELKPYHTNAPRDVHVKKRKPSPAASPAIPKFPVPNQCKRPPAMRYHNPITQPLLLSKYTPPSSNVSCRVLCKYSLAGQC